MSIYIYLESRYLSACLHLAASWELHPGPVLVARGATAGEAGLRAVHGGPEPSARPVLRREAGPQQLLRRPASLLRSNGAYLVDICSNSI